MIENAKEACEYAKQQRENRYHDLVEYILGRVNQTIVDDPTRTCKVICHIIKDDDIEIVTDTRIGWCWPWDRKVMRKVAKHPAIISAFEELARRGFEIYFCPQDSQWFSNNGFLVSWSCACNELENK